MAVDRLSWQVLCSRCGGWVAGDVLGDVATWIRAHRQPGLGTCSVPNAGRLAAAEGRLYDGYTVRLVSLRMSATPVQSFTGRELADRQDDLAEIAAEHERRPSRDRYRAGS